MPANVGYGKKYKEMMSEINKKEMVHEKSESPSQERKEKTRAYFGTFIKKGKK